MRALARLCGLVVCLAAAWPAAGQSLEAPDSAVVGIPAVATIEGVPLAAFAETGVVRVYPRQGLQVFDSVSLIDKAARLLLFAQRPGTYDLVVAAVVDGRMVFLEAQVEVRAAAPPPPAPDKAQRTTNDGGAA